MLNKEEAYKTVIDILLTYGDVQKLELFHYIAKHNPDAVADASIEFKGVPNGLDPVVTPFIMAELKANRKINAIKELRQNTGWGLKESKEYIDNLVEKLRRNGTI